MSLITLKASSKSFCLNQTLKIGKKKNLMPFKGSLCSQEKLSRNENLFYLISMSAVEIWRRQKQM
jgi:hypothetical protein